MIFWCRAKGILTTLRRKIALLETLSKDIIAKLKPTQRLLTWLNSLFIFISSIILYLFSSADYRLKGMESDKGCKGYGMDRLFKCLLYQFMEDLSDRQLEEALKTNCVAKWFCEFGLAEKWSTGLRV